MYEQRAYFHPVPARQSVRTATATRRQESTTTDDVVLPDDDALYDTSLPSSVRRYHTPSRTEVRITHHKGVPPRASQMQHVLPPPARSHRRGSPWLYVGVGMLAMALLSITIEIGSSVGHRMYNDAHYGYPRTYQCDADVKHGGMSHFVVENLHGHVVMIEMQVSTLNKTMIYAGPVLTGTGTDLEPATVTFQDINGDRLPDMLLTVGTSQYTFLNTGHTFRPANASDHLTIGGAQQ